jgi:microcystin degradation protein MlrC
MTLKRMRLADIIICYKEFPHTDVVERAEELLDLALRTIRGEAKPVMSLYDCRQISSYPTTLPLMRGLVDRIKQMEDHRRILSVSIVHCFPYADVPELGSRVLVVGNGDKAAADALARQLGEELVSMRGKTTPDYLDVAAGIAAALAFNDAPVVIADPADNAGGGAPSDNTAILRHLIDHKIEGAAVGPIWDPVAVRLCHDAGERATIPLRFGGKIGPDSGLPINAEVEVAAVARDCWQPFGPTRVPVGDCAAIRIGGVEAVLIANRTQALGLELFTNLGIDPRARRIVVVKSTNHFMGAFGPIARKVIYVESGGPLNRNYAKIPYTRVMRPIWPLDERTTPGLIY